MKLQKDAARFALLACTVLFFASCHRPIAPTGVVTAEASPFVAGLEEVSMDYPEVEFFFESVENRAEGPDQVDLVVWSGDTLSNRWVAEDRLLNLRDIRPRLAGSEEPQLFGNQRYAHGAEEYLLPFAGYAWGLIYRPDVIESVVPGFSKNPPATFAELETVAAALKNAGITPFSLGSQFGWPAAAWFSYLDMRMNGAEAHRQLIEGGRNYTDRTVVAALEKLRVLAERGWFSEAAESMGWMDSVQEVVSGRAAFVLLGAYVFDRIPQSVEIELLRFPEMPGSGRGAGGGGSGELGQIMGIAVSASAGNAEGAAALAHAYTAAGAPGSSALQDGYRTVAHRQDEEPPRARLSRDIISGADFVLPSPDRWASPAFVQRGFRLFRSLVSDPLGMTAEETARLLDLAGE